jgi:hypothetical protein
MQRNNNDNDDNVAPVVLDAAGNPLLAIEDEEQWLQRNALRNEPRQAQAPTAQVREDAQRLQEHERYQQQLHQKYFGDTTSHKKTKEEIAKEDQLKEWEHESILIQTALAVDTNRSSPSSFQVRLAPLARVSDFIYCLAATKDHFGEETLQVSLVDHDPHAVQLLLDLVFQESTTKVADIPHDHWVPLCRVAHFLQCRDLVDECEALFVEAVDAHNCLSLCQLAEDLQLLRLFEVSLNFMMRSLGSVQENNDIYTELSPELRERIETIQRILESRHVKKVFFVNFNEYLSILAEQCEYYRERLMDAERSQELQLSRIRPTSHGYHYAQEKIEQQRVRVQTLESILQQHKQMFGGSRRS